MSSSSASDDYRIAGVERIRGTVRAYPLASMMLALLLGGGGSSGVIGVIGMLTGRDLHIDTNVAVAGDDCDDKLDSCREKVGLLVDVLSDCTRRAPVCE